MHFLFLFFSAAPGNDKITKLDKKTLETNNDNGIKDLENSKKYKKKKMNNF